MNNQINNRFTVNDEGVQRMIDNNSAMYYSNQMIIAQNMTHRPVNAIKAYSAKQKEWKLGYFLAEYVMNRGRKLRRSPDGTLIVLGRESVLTYVKAIAGMYIKQRHLALTPMAPQEDPSLGLFWLLSKKKKVKIRPSLVNCILTGVSLKIISATTTPISSKQSVLIPSSSEERQSKEKRLKDLKEEIMTLNAQLLKKKEAFSLEKIDKEIRKMKKERNGMIDKDDRRMAAALIKAKKGERWRNFNELEVLRQELKALRRESLKYTSRKQHSDDSVDLPTELKQTRFSGTDYGLKTMSVTVPISMKMFNTHLNLYNKFHPDNSLPVVKVKEKYLRLPKAFKITAAEINHSSLKNKFQYSTEKRKKKYS
ncbi:hypothetical protein G6F70_006787 [Rhizopus microsporus]|nr:hypothetical protein G6F70_006787 [Rhizopus microsporus]KAG1209048.1 hypothetical protein G6F69_006689 [Rhizopus microsporus]